MSEDTKTFKVIKRFHGFESLQDFERDMMWAIEHELEFPPEFEGVLKVTLEYDEKQETSD